MTPPRVVTRGRTSAQASAGRRGRRPLRFARGRAAAGACPSSGPAGPPSPKGEGKGCCWRQREVAAGWGTPPPTGCPGKGGSGSLPLIRPCGATFPQGGRQGLLLAAAGGRGGVGDAAPYGLPGEGRQREPAPHPALRGHLPPRGKARAVVGGSGRSRRGLRGHSFPGRRTVGAGHARPGGWREHPSMVRSVGRGLDPSAGVGGSGSLRGW